MSYDPNDNGGMNPFTADFIRQNARIELEILEEESWMHSAEWIQYVRTEIDDCFVSDFL